MLDTYNSNTKFHVGYLGMPLQMAISFLNLYTKENKKYLNINLN